MNVFRDLKTKNVFRDLKTMNVLPEFFRKWRIRKVEKRLQTATTHLDELMTMMSLPYFLRLVELVENVPEVRDDVLRALLERDSSNGRERFLERIHAIRDRLYDLNNDLYGDFDNILYADRIIDDARETAVKFRRALDEMAK